MTLSEELDLLVSKVQSISNEKRYWLVRTQAGELYDTFRRNGIIALEHKEVPLSLIESLKKEYGTNNYLILNGLKERIKIEHEKNDSQEILNTRQIGLIASQIYKLVFEVKKDDIVVIPSENSEIVSFGVVKENFIGDFNRKDINDFELTSSLIRRVNWIKDIRRFKLDPNLYYIFTAHQAINDISHYNDIIERSLRDFYIINDEAHLIINIQTEQEISASDLFGVGTNLLKFIDDFSKEYQLGISSKDLQVTVNVNSPGKIDLKSKIKKTTLFAGIVLAIFGGGYEDKEGHSFKTPGIPGLIKAVSDYRSDELDRDIKEQIIDIYKDSLRIKSPEDLVTLLKQFSDNKDIAK